MWHFLALSGTKSDSFINKLKHPDYTLGVEGANQATLIRLTAPNHTTDAHDRDEYPSPTHEHLR